ncbi:hypothetical protein GCM10010358_73350 [Streptomyces minutiscleroticus]|uniref:Uncharacterized protein n=1 Tax=Streptomyces minutiscleroticus TaxID=68238 RepID=A0A918P0C9_9ACTN|nr:hypothetical protein [Streptomyces minutiscleroticus]GGY10133.1 hypothetical protein GCM10010358_73350 [Streptomyces minutiscleroticus]
MTIRLDRGHRPGHGTATALHGVLLGALHSTVRGALLGALRTLFATTAIFAGQRA